MRAVAYRRPLPIAHQESLVDIELPAPSPGARDLLVKVAAVSVNPVDVKVRAGVDPRGETKILGWDVAGVVVEAGEQVARFRPGDEIYYCAAFDRPGANAEFHLVDERLVGRKPKNLSFAEAAALPLTALTAWGALFERLGLRPGGGGEPRTLLVTGAAVSVGSMALQLARALTDVSVIATASRFETRAWALQMGAHHVVRHQEPLVEEVREIAPQGIDFVLSSVATDRHFEALAELLRPFGALVALDEPATIDHLKLKWKSTSLHWHVVFTRSLYETPDMEAQGECLNEISELLDAGRLRSTMTQSFGTITGANLRRAHAFVESGRAIGKVVLSGF